MGLKYKMKRPEAVEALAEAGISTADQLAKESGISRASAQQVFRSEKVTLRVAIQVVHRLQAMGAEATVGMMFEEIKS